MPLLSGDQQRVRCWERLWLPSLFSYIKGWKFSPAFPLDNHSLPRHKSGERVTPFPDVPVDGVSFSSGNTREARSRCCQYETLNR